MIRALVYILVYTHALEKDSDLNETLPSSDKGYKHMKECPPSSHLLLSFLRRCS